MEQKNLGWAYYREYYKGLIHEEIEGKIKMSGGSVEAQKMFKNGYPLRYQGEYLDLLHERLRKSANAMIEGQIAGRGILSGVGIKHNMGLLNELVMGFTFDFTTGMPFIAGSSLKGALRAHCERNTPTILQPLLENEQHPFTQKQFVDLLFEGKDTRNPKAPRWLSTYEQCHFIGAAPAVDVLLGTDIITPHQHPLKKPTPLPFLKMQAGGHFQFYFYLSAHVTSFFPADQLLDCFAQMLTRYGLGAKTNYDFGRIDQATWEKF
ncbi:type III-B CRISPR module RAMP protein Cmr6 [Haliscomenobacter hydrossis]|uniref:CRISPR-associated RAMP protein, Cmr6 family n=1 Tax=Haliscomenobacter hydrossis (strain ATCC 27775 / DSM 1100 / LMG 10767 / O) TaxID=760192 RepID=F4L832_HALH1|nr:type III-B CRISPR module RAMP protein Cmr6 [Haliscomenobacter hydrossis]AEE54540.1 CRISPR-associated RAMP protein, Cmr6 family [Haliscomenobacter hydrossis DSM 1100]